jgi:predicted ester cyclase
VRALQDLVDDFYQRAWNRWDDGVVDEILAPGFVFRGSLGDRVVGRTGWRGYRDGIRAAVPDFHNEIVDLVVAGDRAAARLRYSGHHVGTLLGVPGTGAAIAYEGAAFFVAQDGVLTSAWVLGDLAGLRAQLIG